MTHTEKIELILIVVVLTFVLLFSYRLPAQINLSTLVLSLASVLLLQGLIRDLWYLYSKRKVDSLDNPVKHVQCMCLESTIGFSGILIGLLLLSSNIDGDVGISGVLWPCILAVVLTGGFLIKDLVIEWNPWRIYKEKDHINIVFSWKKIK